MAKKVYIGVGGVARKVKKLYFGVGGVARKVKKGYIGIGGVARPFFSFGPSVTYYGTLDNIKSGMRCCVGASVGNYACFCGNATYPTQYDNNLTRTQYNSGDHNGSIMCACEMGDKAFFAWGDYSDRDYEEKPDCTCWTYDANLVTANAYLNTLELGVLTCASPSSSYVILLGKMNKFRAITSDLSSISSVSGTITTRHNASGLKIGNYAVFAGGTPYAGSGSALFKSEVDAIDANLVITSLTALQAGRYGLSGAKAGSLGVFAGGVSQKSGSTGQVSALVDIYDENLVHTIGPSLGTARMRSASTECGNCAIFCGGSTTTSSDYSAVCDVIDNSGALISTDMTLSYARCWYECTNPGAATVGNYAIVVGGSASDATYSKYVDVFTAID